MGRIRNQLVIISLLFLLFGCDDKKRQPTDHTASASTTVISSKAPEISQPESNQPESNKFSPTEALIKKYHGKQLEVLDASEVILEGTSTLIITFSVPLDPKQNFANLVRLVDSNNGYVDGAWELSDNGLELRFRYLDPNRKLKVTVDKMLLAINDSRLKSTYQTALTTQDRKPMVRFASNGTLLPKQTMSGLPVMTLNIDKIDVNFFRIKPEKLSDFISHVGVVNQLYTWDSKKLSQYTDLVYSSRFDLTPHRNAQETVILNLAPISELQQEGVYIAVMSQAGSYNDTIPATIFSISNIGLSLHRYESGKLSILTHALDSGAVIPDVDLMLYCNRVSNNSSHQDNPCNLERAKTDKTGYAEIKLTDADNYFLVTARRGDELSFLTIDGAALDLSEFNLSGSRFYQKQLFAFGPRDLYRPGETVQLNALLRDADGQLLPNQPIKVEILSPFDKPVKDFIWQPTSSFQKESLQKESLQADGFQTDGLDQHGFYQTTYTIPTSAATGKWSFRFNLGDDDYRYYKFSVEEFLPERMALDITVPATHPIVLGDPLNFNLKGWYLYGAPASENSVEGNLYMKKVDEIAELPNFKIGSVTEVNLDHRLDSINQQMDGNGVLQVAVNSQEFGELHSPVNIILQASLLDDGGLPVTRSASQIVWPTEHMPAIRAMFKESSHYNWISDRYENRAVVNFGDSANFEVAYINTEGQKLPTNELKMRIVRERHNAYWSWSEMDSGWQMKENIKEFILSEEPLSIPAEGTAKVSYQPNDWGAYRIEIVDTTTNIVSSMRFWSGWDDGTNGDDAIRPDQIKLRLDKNSYIAGDVAKVHIDAPVAGSGYIALESSDGMLWKQDITVDEGGLDVEIPIKAWERHDLYINAMVIRPSTDASVQTVKRAVGLLYLPLDTADRQLHLTIDAPQKVEPEKSVTVKLQLDKASKDRKAMVLVSAVDSGILNIDKFRLPDPYNAFLGRKRYGVDLYDLYGKLIESSGRQVNTRFGGDNLTADEDGGKRPLTSVKIVAQQLKLVELNENGEATIDLAIPDFNGQLRLMAQVWDEDRFGSAQQIMTVAAPVVAELTTPRFLSGGDHAILTLDLNNLTSQQQTVQVNITTADLLHQEIPNSETVTLTPNNRQMIQIPVIADYGYGEGTIEIDIKGIKLDDGSDYGLSRSWQLGVRPAYPATVKNYAIAVKSGEKWSLPEAATTDLIDNTVETKLVVSNQPTLNITQYIQTLFAYPYGCLEQTISGLYPSLYINQAELTALGIKSEADDKRREKVQQGIERILGMQRSNGSFGLWSRDSEEEYWLTAYAVDFLLQARDRGYQVNSDALDSALKRLEEYLYDSTAFYNSYYATDSSDYMQIATKTYAALILAKQNKITPAIRNQINQIATNILDLNSKQSLISPLPVAQLALAAKLAGIEKVYEDLMPIALTVNRVDSDNWLGDYGSQIRDKALIYALLVANNIEVDNQPNYLFSLTNLLSDKRYFSTQELNALFLAAYEIEQHRPPHQFEFELNGATIKADKTVRESFAGRKSLTIANGDESEPLYVRVAVTGYSSEAPAPTTQNSVLSIRRSYYDMQGKEVKPDQFEVGDLILVMLDVSATKTIYDALVVDFIPAGLQLENQNLMNSSVNLLNIPEVAHLLQYEDSSAIKYQEYRDDRFVAAMSLDGYKPHKRIAYLARAVTAGDYVNPNPYVESMYHPEWFAIGEVPTMMTIIRRDSVTAN